MDAPRLFHTRPALDGLGRYRLMVTLSATGHERLDQLCFAHYGAVHGIVEAVLDTNPGLADLGIVPPKGTVIVLPEVETEQTRPVVRLWD